MEQKNNWKKGVGRLGVMQPLLGSWMAIDNSPIGKVTCIREFTTALNRKYLQLKATWKLPKGDYEELALYGVHDDTIKFWSFTSDGKRSEGYLSDAADIHPDAVCFEAQMPAGIARMIYWPHPEGGFNWAVESKNKKGWNRFTLHHYQQMK